MCVDIRSYIDCIGDDFEQFGGFWSPNEGDIESNSFGLPPLFFGPFRILSPHSPFLPFLEEDTVSLTILPTSDTNYAAIFI